MHNYPAYRRLFYGIAALAAALLFNGVAFAQGVTSSGITGSVVDSKGAPVAGATIVATHEPTGTRSFAKTTSSGDYTLTGLKPGGPYTVTVSTSAGTAAPKTGLYLEVGSELSGPQTIFTVGSEIVQMEALTVSSTKAVDATFNEAAMTNTMNIAAAQVPQIVTVRRDLQDIADIDPRVTLMQVSPTDSQYTMSVAGQNPRENLILIDGVSATDNFGLNSNGYAGFRNPAPPEWIESLTFDVNEYDPIYSGFSGAVMNASLKSGTNEFHGSLYEIYTGTNFRGPDPVVGVLGPHEAVNEHTTGATFGGPIIKDKLFFFVGYDAFREIAAPPVQDFIPDDTAATAATIIPGSSSGIVDQIIAHTESAYGFNPGTLTAVNHVWEQNFVGKIDWNISDAQKFEFTFRHTAGEAPNFYEYTGSYYTSLSASWYNTYRTDQSYTAKLTSDWSEYIPNFSTEIEATYKRYNGTARLNGNVFPAVFIGGIPGASINGGTSPFELFLGQYWAYQDNNIYTWEQEEHLYGEYILGAQTFKFGIQFDRSAYTDTFIPNILGSYYFATVQDYLNSTPTFVEQEVPNSGYTLGSDVSHYHAMYVSPLISDTWRPIDNLTIMAGLRGDYYYEPQKPAFSQVFYNSFNYSNRANADGTSVLSPRLGFNYTFPDKWKTQVRGGGGLVVGSFPVVWYENAFNNAGQLNTITDGSTSFSSTTTPVSNYKFTGSTPTSLVGIVAPSSSLPSFDIIDPNFKLPSNWKENLAVDQQLPWFGFILSGMADFMQVNKDVKLYQLNYETAAAAGLSGPAYMPDGAIRYAGNVTTGLSSSTWASYYPSAPIAATSSAGGLFASVTSTSSSTLQAVKTSGPVYELTNTDKGGSQMYTIVLHRPLTDGWGLSFAYTHTHATEVDPSPSSVASSGYADLYGVNPNDNIAYRSQWAEPDKFVITGTREFKFFKPKYSATRISLQYIAQTGQAYSYVFKGDANGDGIGDASLFYVPTGPNDPKVEWASTTDESNFFTWLSQNPDLEKYEGKIAPRNAFYAPWQHTLNLHLEQEIPIYGNARFTLFADCFNFGNLLNKNWGVVANYDNSFNVKTEVGTGFDPKGNGGQGAYVYMFNSGTQGGYTVFNGNTYPGTIYSDMSRWNIQIGARLEF